MPRAELRRISTELALIDCDTTEETDRLSARFFDAELPWLRCVSRGARTILIEHSAHVSSKLVADLLESFQLAAVDVGAINAEFDAGETLEIPTFYDGPDLAGVAESTGLSTSEVIELHAGALYTVSFVGFGAGFAYLTGLPDQLQLPRRANPRKQVPRGAVAIAGQYSGVYPRPTPGGWHILGRTDLAIWDPDRDPPGLFRAGLRVRFVAVAHGDRSVSNGPPRAIVQPSAVGHESRDVVVGQLVGQHTLQDLGRPGAGRQGLSRSGAIDQGALKRANRLVGNSENNVCIEIGPFPLQLFFGKATLVAVSGTARSIHENGIACALEAPFVVEAGSTVEFGPCTDGMYTYLAFGGGGLDVRHTLGSGSHDSLSGFGPPPLKNGQRLVLKTEPIGDISADVAPVRPRPEVVRFVAGPRVDWFESDVLETLGSGDYTVSNEVNRVGVRLNGPPLLRRRSEELPPEPMIPGYIQVPPNGQPVVLLRDHGATGGYPVVGLVLPEDLWIVGQTRPGQSIRFRQVRP